jgi:cytochrome c oxidase cbb3-type subunit III
MKSHTLKSIRKAFLGLLTIMGLPSFAMAQDTSIGGFSPETAFYIVIIMAFVVALLVLAVAIYALQVMTLMLEKEAEKKASEQGVPIETAPSWWDNLMEKMTRRVPADQEHTIELDHNYDGIRELDNHLPPWWKWLFYVTIVFGVVYMLVYHVIDNDTFLLQKAEYDKEIAQAEAKKAAMPVTFDEANIAFDDSPDALAKGKQIYVNNCAACHREDGGGGIGPNLADEYWLHGGSMQEVYDLIKEGVPDKGMISWKQMLSPEQMKNVASYILTFQGTTPPQAKEPQGEKYVPQEAEAPEEEAPAEAAGM